MANEQIHRYEMVSLTRCGDAWQELKADKDGDWISYDDHLAATNELREGQMHLAMELEAKDEQIRKLRDALGRIRFGVMLMVPEPQKSGFIEIIDAALKEGE